MKTNKKAMRVYRLRLLAVVLLLGFVTVAGASVAQRLGAQWGQYLPRQPLMPLVTPPSWAL